MEEKTADIKKKKKDTPLFITGIIMLATSIFQMILCAFVIASIILEFILKDVLGDELNISNFYIAIMGVLLVFSLAVIIVAFYAGICGIKQLDLIKCKKLATFLIVVNAVSFAASIISYFCLDGYLDLNELAGLIFNVVFCVIVPVLYLIFADKALKHSEPKSKYENIINSI